MNLLGFRHVVVLVIFIGIVISYMLRVNLSVAILAMVNHTALAEMSKAQSVQQTHSVWNSSSSNDACDVSPMGANVPSAPVVQDGQFLWDAETRGIILGSFSYGFLFTEIPGGYLAYRFGPKWIIAFGMLWTSIFTMMTPLTVQLKLPLLIAVRVLEGFGEGLMYPCLTATLCHWIPPKERARVNVFTFSGIGYGGIIGFPFSAALCNTAMGWPLLFYVFGAIGIAWVILWSVLVSSTPATSRWIGKEEQAYIQGELEYLRDEKNDSHSCCSIPWLDIVKTPAIWAIVLSHLSFTWGNNTVINLLPTFYKDTLHIDLAANGLYSALPYVAYILFAYCAGISSDLLINRGILSVKNTRKLMDCLSHLVPGVFLLLSTVIGCNVAAAVFFMCIAIGFKGCNGAGSIISIFDVAGRFAGLIYGVYNTLSALVGVVAPYVAGAITARDSTVNGWRLVFGISAALYFLSSIVFVLFAQGETADWAKGAKSEKKKSVASSH